MRILLSTIGSRGDVQPLVAIALALQAQGQEVRLCAARLLRLDRESGNARHTDWSGTAES